MLQILTKPVSFDEFINWYPDNSIVRYELHNGVIVEMTPPAGEHEEVKGFLTAKFIIEITRLNLPFFIPNQAIVKVTNKETGYLPDILLLDKTNLKNEPLWQKSSTVSQAKSIPLVVEIVSTNWRDDYFVKFADYVRVASRREEIGIPEYWIVDYAGLGGKRFLGSPKQPTISIYQFIDDEYQLRQFRGDERIISPLFPELNLTTAQVFRGY
jgi:Uma2 family endonuclease